jgi:predicted hydrocarbon binding protein
MDLKIDHTFDENTYRHSINGHTFVLHCHHYLSLTTRVAEEFADIGGAEVLREVAEDSILPLLEDYLRQNQVSAPGDRLEVGSRYYSFMGLGRMEVAGDASGGEVRLRHSHVDEGWQKKWGKHDKPINHFTCGFVAAVFAAAFGKPARSYRVTETAAMVTGAAVGVLAVKAA